VVVDALISLLAFLAVVAAVRGKTWDSSRGKWWRAITLSGWLSLALGAATLGLSIHRSYQEGETKRQTATAAANQILADLAPQATFYRLLLLKQHIDPISLGKELTQFQGFLESKVNRHVEALPLKVQQAAENTLTAQKQLLMVVERRHMPDYSEVQLRSTIEACFSALIAFGDELLAVTGNNDGMMNTAVVSRTGNVTWHPTRLLQKKPSDQK